MLSETLKHFIFVRFFPFQDPKFPHNVLDLNFLSTQLPLVQNIFRSLENQTNKNFDLLFIMHQNFFDELLRLTILRLMPRTYFEDHSVIANFIGWEFFLYLNLKARILCVRNM